MNRKHKDKNSCVIGTQDPYTMWSRRSVGPGHSWSSTGPQRRWFSFRDAPVPFHQNAWDPSTVPVGPSLLLIYLQPVWFSCKFRHDVCSGWHRSPPGMWWSTTKEEPQVNTALWFENKKGYLLYLLLLWAYCFSCACPPHISSCYPISIACAEWLSHVHTIITLHFQPSQSHKYLVYRILMFIQSTGLHCLGTIARQGPFGRKKKTIPNEK